MSMKQKYEESRKVNNIYSFHGIVTQKATSQSLPLWKPQATYSYM
jgi:hypothetical protein